MLSLPPTGFISDFGERERGLDGIEAPGGVEHLVVRSDAFAADIGDKLSGSSLGENALGGFTASAGHADDFNSRISLLERAGLKNLAPTTNLNIHLRFVSRRFDNFFPLAFTDIGRPARFCQRK